MVKDIQRDYGVELDYHKLWMGKEIAMHDIHGTDNGSYDKLRWCHIKNKYKGSLLVAVAKDANDDLFTLAYAVVDAENDSNWDWFFYRLKEVLASQGIIFFHGFTFFSDRHSGLIKAIHSMFPGSHHAYCLRHIVDNFVKLVLRKYPFRNKRHWSSVLKKAAYAPSRHEFDEHINQITESMPLAIEFIVNSSPENWANALFLGKRWGIINNNMAESWNNWVKAGRYLPIVSLVDHIRIQIMTMMHQRRESSLKMVQELSPRKEKDVSLACSKSRTLKVHRSSGSRFEVVDMDKTFAIDLNLLSCSCRAWQIYGLPCKHACACIESKSLSVYRFCDDFFKMERYRQSYKGVINPIPTFDMYEGYIDEGDIIYAPTVRSQPGRRKTQRIPSQVEHHVTKCKRCGRTGHNRRTCKEAIN
ncbi:uncharacterized protein [Henckelia pumila]|uniref:uncharacterized protein n=1 Tax=Henckelia pumila TaxID=405737 RepID=UPI003C6E0017